jgi:hypothetical protein
MKVSRAGAREWQYRFFAPSLGTTRGFLMEGKTYVVSQERSAEQLKIFDELASIRMLRQDIEQFGRVTAETWQQVHNEELTFVAESINAPLSTTFQLENGESGLVDERGVRLQEALARGLQAAEEAAYGDSRYWFNVRRAVHEYEEGQAVQRMMNDAYGANTIISFSPFPEEAYRQYGPKPLKSIGFQPERKLGFIRVYNKKSDQELEVISLSVDNSDLEAFRATAAQFGKQIPEDMTSDDYLAERIELALDLAEQSHVSNTARTLYDSSMSALYGGEFSAGRPHRNERDAWAFIASQKDLVSHYMNELEMLARQKKKVDVRTKNTLTFGFWAALKERYSASTDAENGSSCEYLNLGQIQSLNMEISRAYNRAASRHEQMVACGGSIGVSSNFAELSPENAMSSIMGDSSGEKAESWVWKSGICKVDNCPSRPSNTKVGPCSVCKTCQHIFDKGKDPANEYKLRRKNFKYN